MSKVFRQTQGKNSSTPVVCPAGTPSIVLMTCVITNSKWAWTLVTITCHWSIIWCWKEMPAVMWYWIPFLFFFSFSFFLTWCCRIMLMSQKNIYFISASFDSWMIILWTNNGVSFYHAVLLRQHLRSLQVGFNLVFIFLSWTCQISKILILITSLKRKKYL